MAAPVGPAVTVPTPARNPSAHASSTVPFVIESAVLSILVCAALFLLQWRYGFNWSDEGWLWYISQRTALGQIPIRDFFSYDPGRYYWSAFLFKMLRGDGLFEQLIANAAFGALGLAAIYFAMARMQVNRAWRIAMLIVLAIMLGFPRHKTYEQALSLICAAAAAFVISRPSAVKRWFGFGVAIGVAAFIGRNSGVYFAGAALLLIVLLKAARAQFRLSRAMLACVAGTVLGYSPMIFMLAFVRGFASAFYQSILFTPHWQLSLPIPFPWHLHVKGLPTVDMLQARAVSLLCIVVPITYLFAIWKWMKRSDARLLQLGAAASVAGLPYLHHAFSRADFFHIAQGILPFAIVAGVLALQFWCSGRRPLSLVSAGLASALVLAAWLPYEPLIQHLRSKTGSMQQVAINGKMFYVDSQQAQVMEAVSRAFEDCGSANGTFLAAPYYPGLYAFLKTKSPLWDLYFLWPRDQALQQKQIADLKQNNVSLVLLNRAAAMDGIEALRISHSHPDLVAYVTHTYNRAGKNLPEGFEIYYSSQCKISPL